MRASARDRRLVKVFRVRYERRGTIADYAVVATSEIRALSDVVRLHHGFTDQDTLDEKRAQHGFTVTSTPWRGPVPTIANRIEIGGAE